MAQIWKSVRFLAAAFLICLAGCNRHYGPAVASPSESTLRVGFGRLPSADPQSGMQQAAAYVTLEGLVRPSADGRPAAWLSDHWSVTPDGLTWTFHLRPGVKFHNGKPLDAAIVEQVLNARLPGVLGVGFDDLKEIRAVSDAEVQISLAQPSTFLIEALDVPISDPGTSMIGTGPYYMNSKPGEPIELLANDQYYGGTPLLKRVVFAPYDSTRAAWADLLRNKIDMLYEVGLDAFASLEPSTQVRIIRTRHSYQHMLLLNVQKPQLKDQNVRRALTSAIDREQLVAEGLDGHGTPADGPVWPDHWAYDPTIGRATYKPTMIRSPEHPLILHCIYGADASRERLALALQKQLYAVGVNLELEALAPEMVMRRWRSGDFDAILSDFVQGPNLYRPYLFWHSKGPANFAHYADPLVDRSLDAIRHATNDTSYGTAVHDFQQAIADDPPAIFLAWGERVRAVSTRFDLPETGGEVWGPYLGLWRPRPESTERTTSH